MRLDDFISRAELLELIGKCPPDCLFWLNNIGGISVLDASGGYLGMISRHFLPNGSQFMLALAHDDDATERLPFA